jgi:hypothetical protein
VAKSRGSQAICVLFPILAGTLCAAPPSSSPVLVELFTSEGCSDCPPADRLLEQLDRAQPVAGAEIIVFSEHVDYWDRLGWKDPFSEHLFSQRQEDYARRFRLDGPYTPQMVVDGSAEFVGSDSRRALAAIGASAKTQKTAVRISRLSGSHVRVEVDPPPGLTSNVYLAVVEKTGDSHVLRGENAGRNLHHVAIVRRIEALGKCRGPVRFDQDVIKEESSNPAFRLVAFVQDGTSGTIHGAAVLENR